MNGLKISIINDKKILQIRQKDNVLTLPMQDPAYFWEHSIRIDHEPFTQTVLEILNIINENMPAHIDYSCEMSNQELIFQKQEQLRRQISCIQYLNENILEEKRSLTADEVMDCLYVL